MEDTAQFKALVTSLSDSEIKRLTELKRRKSHSLQVAVKVEIELENPNNVWKGILILLITPRTATIAYIILVLIVAVSTIFGQYYV